MMKVFAYRKMQHLHESIKVAGSTQRRNLKNEQLKKKIQLTKN